MANSIDLNFDAKRSFGRELPSVYVDFVDISYGKVIDEITHEESIGVNPEAGTFVNGSFSIYFTKEATQSNEDISQWLIDNLDGLYLYSWLSLWVDKSINEKVKNSSIRFTRIILFYGTNAAPRSEFDIVTTQRMICHQ